MVHFSFYIRAFFSTTPTQDTLQPDDGCIPSFYERFPLYLGFLPSFWSEFAFRKARPLEV